MKLATIFDLCEGFKHPERDVRVGWMAAHTAEWAVGNVRKSDGSRLSLRDREGNAAADALAKRSAKLQRIPKWLRQKVELSELVATRAAIQLGITIEAANNHTIVDTDCNGVLHSKKCRDSEGDPKAVLIKEAAKKADKARATNCELAKENKKDVTAERATDSKLEDWTSNGTAQSKSRRATVYGYKGKRAIVKRLKEWCKDVKATSHTQPTTEWLRREGSKLAVAASSENFSSLRV